MKTVKMAYKARIWIPKALATEARLQALTTAAGGCTLHSLQGRWLAPAESPDAPHREVVKEAIVLVEVFAMGGHAAANTSAEVFNLVMALAKDGEKAVLYEVDGVPYMYE